MELVPVQVSARSHSLAAARQTAPAFPAGCWHVTFLPSQRSRVHGLPSSVQDTPESCSASAGQLAVVPEHVSATSHSPALGRQTVPGGAKLSAGHEGPVPEQVSARSQLPAADRHTVVDGRKASAGHAADVPVQCSAASQTPAERRHTSVVGRNVSAGQSVEVPLQCSSMSHGPADGRQVTPPVPAGWARVLSAPHWSSVHGLPSLQSPSARQATTATSPPPEIVKGELVSRSMTNAVATSPSGF